MGLPLTSLAHMAITGMMPTLPGVLPYVLHFHAGHTVGPKNIYLKPKLYHPERKGAKNGETLKKLVSNYPGNYYWNTWKASL